MESIHDKSPDTQRLIFLIWFLVEILQYGPLPWKRYPSVLFLYPGKFKLSETQNVFKKLAKFNFYITTVVHYINRSKFAGGSEGEDYEHSTPISRDRTGEYWPELRSWLYRPRCARSVQKRPLAMVVQRGSGRNLALSFDYLGQRRFFKINLPASEQTSF